MGAFWRVNGIKGLGCGRNVYFRGHQMPTKVDLTGTWRTFCGTEGNVSFGVKWRYRPGSNSNGDGGVESHVSRRTRNLGHPGRGADGLAVKIQGGSGAMARDGSFHCELEKSKDEDDNGKPVMTIKCRGELVSGAPAGEIKELVRPLIPLGGRIIIDFGDVRHLDSAGLGALVGLKV